MFDTIEELISTYPIGTIYISSKVDIKDVWCPTLSDVLVLKKEYGEDNVRPHPFDKESYICSRDVSYAVEGYLFDGENGGQHEIVGTDGFQLI